MPALQQGLERQGVQPDELHIDRGYITSPMVNEVLDMDMRSRQLTCRG